MGQRGSGDYVLLGRRDDIISSHSGLNINAGWIESRIRAEEEKIVNVLMVGGRGRPCMAILVEVRADEYGERQDVANKVRKAVEKVNQGLRDWEKVERDMVAVLEKGKTLPVTAKGNVKRKDAERSFAKEINILYEGLC